MDSGTVGDRVYLDVSVNGTPIGRLTFGLYRETPRTSANFKHLCLGDKGRGRDLGKPLHFRGNKFHRVIKGFMA